MKKIDIIASCEQCSNCLKYITEDCRGEAFFCGAQDDRLIDASRKHLENRAIPDWCPLETYAEVAQAPGPIILPGMPHLEWMTENLSGHGGTEIDGCTYYTYDEAVEAIKQLGDGWRLPTRGEMVDLDDLGSTWDDERKGRWFGGNHDTDHAGSLFLEATGYRHRESGALTYVGTYGYYWSSSSYYAGSYGAGYLGFNSSVVYPLSGTTRAYGRSVRCVRNVK